MCMLSVWREGGASPVTHGVSLKLMSVFILLFLLTSYGSEIRTVVMFTV